MMRKILISDSRQEKFDGKKEFSLTVQTKLKLVEIGERSGGYKVEINARTMQRRWRFLKLIGTSRRNRKENTFVNTWRLFCLKQPWNWTWHDASSQLKIVETFLGSFKRFFTMSKFFYIAQFIHGDYYLEKKLKKIQTQLTINSWSLGTVLRKVIVQFWFLHYK